MSGYSGSTVGVELAKSRLKGWMNESVSDGLRPRWSGWLKERRSWLSRTDKRMTEDGVCRCREVTRNR